MKNKFSRGFTLIELLVVIAIIGVLASGVLVAINPLEQIKKARDAQRKQDLAQIQKPLEVYYNDNGRYPTLLTDLSSQYMAVVPKDPLGTSYGYYLENGGYRLFAKLDRCSDSQVIAGITCATEPYNYSVVSPNLSVAKYETVGGGSTPTSAPASPTPTVSAPTPTTSVSTPTPTLTPSTSTPTPTPTPSLCASGVNAWQIFSASMVGCNGFVVNNNAATLCASGSHVCSPVEYLQRGGKTIVPTTNRWLLTTNVSDGPTCPPSSVCTSGNYGNCYVIQSGGSNVLISSDIQLAFTSSCATISSDNVGYFRENTSPTQSTLGSMCCSN